MIDRVEIRAFKSLAETSVELGVVNVFVGANGVGKSNLLEAIGVLGAAAGGRVDDAALMRRGVRPGVPEVYRSSFRTDAAAPHVGLTARGYGSEYRVALENPPGGVDDAWRYSEERVSSVGGETIFDRSWSPIAGSDTRGDGAEVAMFPDAKAHAELITALQRFRIYSPDTPTLRGLVVDTRQESPIGLSGGRLAEAVQSTFDLLAPDRAESVRESILDLLDWVAGFEVASSASVPMSRSVPTTPFVLKFRDRFMADHQPFVSGYDASEGALVVLFLMVLALHPSAPRIFAVDNIDHGLNPRLARALTKQVVEWLLASGDRQALFTAHNPLVLDGLPLQDDRVRLFAVDRTNTGKTVLNRIVVDDAMMARAGEGWSLSRMWVAGMLGGVPDV